ncbi:MAG TPA: crosslink repair DNA glycosylase YcaQ family protein, partial [Spirochaetia bacterium]|nr:crosslink repair DNA glycosylase YcaQ family protein [Spirochaetia bacterium]
DDLSVEAAEDALLHRYLHSYGPATAADLAAWSGVRRRDADTIWGRAASELLAVDVEGREASLLASDLEVLLQAEVERPSVRLLPYFDSYILAHAERSYVAPKDRPAVYRPQGWVSAVLLVDGSARGTWTHETKRSLLRVTVKPFARLSRAVSRLLRREVELLAPFLGCTQVELRIDDEP